MHQWGPEQQESFEKIKEALATKPVLAIYNPTAETYLEKDASSIALGGVLMQIDPVTKEKHPVAYFSQKVPKAKKHLAAFDQELNVITNACQFF